MTSNVNFDIRPETIGIIVSDQTIILQLFIIALYVVSQPLNRIFFKHSPVS